ncbi:hypothetical protein [Persephonella sp. KM09-Lau-8]|uniref:hypothetical protein n=1 Tax=Persephonella sp. KM09-Lau-8 TaxID=1158345 RepID=UPI000495AA14|nr:hypothetical protein [Persephonella sp. KM09-Lau-8]
MAVITIFDLAKLGINYPKCPACSYESSIFLTAEDPTEDIIEIFKKDELEKLETPPICNNCFCEILNENKSYKFKYFTRR